MVDPWRVILSVDSPLCAVELQPSSNVPVSTYLGAKSAINCRRDVCSFCVLATPRYSSNGSISCSSTEPGSSGRHKIDSASPHRHLVGSTRHDDTTVKESYQQLDGTRNVEQIKKDKQSRRIQFLEAQCHWLKGSYTAASDALRETQQELVQQQVCVMEKTTELEDLNFRLWSNNKLEAQLDQQLREPVHRATTFECDESQHRHAVENVARSFRRKRKHHEANDDLDARNWKRRRYS